MLSTSRPIHEINSTGEAVLRDSGRSVSYPRETLSRHQGKSTKDGKREGGRERESVDLVPLLPRDELRVGAKYGSFLSLAVILSDRGCENLSRRQGNHEPPTLVMERLAASQTYEVVAVAGRRQGGLRQLAHSL